MVGIMANFMDVECGRSYIDELFSNDEEKCSEAVVLLKNSVIGSNNQKRSIIEQGVLPRLINLLIDQKSPPKLQVDVAYTLNSLAKGTDAHLKSVIDSGVVPVLLQGLYSGHPRVVEACLCCLKTVFRHKTAPLDMIYADTNIVPHMISLMQMSTVNQISVASILGSACKTRDHQNFLASNGAVQAINVLLCSPLSDVQLPALLCLAYLIYANDSVSGLVASTSCGDRSMIEEIDRLMDRDKSVDMQIAAARCATSLYRCGVMDEQDPRIVYKALPCLVRMCRKSEKIEHRIQAAETLAYLTEISANLQRIAAISNHLIPTISSFLWSEPGSEISLGEESSRQMKKAAFRVFSSLGANDEDIRKRIIETDHLMECLVTALEDSDGKLQMAAIGCLHSLSRSVQLLRTTFQDHPVWRPLVKVLSVPTSSVEPLVVASSTLCNLLLEFSPSGEPIVESGAVEMLCALAHKYEPALRLNGVWGLMNMAFQAEQRIKVQIITTLGSDQIFRLLSDQDINVVMKTLGLLRNLLSNKHHIDHIMALYGKQIMQAVVLILESDNVPEVKEQALCILANIADGDSAKQFIMSNEDVLKKVTNYMLHINNKLQIAAVFCIQNLIWADDDGSLDRQSKLRDIGVYRILQQLLTTTDTALFERVKGALQQFR